MYMLEDLKNLPDHIEFDHKVFLFRLYVTAWGKVALCYQNDKYVSMKAFSIVIDPLAKETFISTDIYEPSTVRNFDEAYGLMYRTMVANGFIDIEEDEIRKCVESEEFDESYEEDALKFRDEHFSIEDYDLI